MKLAWMGTAGFCLDTTQNTILIDPYLTRNQNAVPRQKLKVEDIDTGDLIFISHGHFDHIYDVPVIASKTKAMVYCGEGIDITLVREYPEGQVLSWRFIIEGKMIHHFGSGGSTVEELQRLGRQPTDILLVPMQGHTHIADIAHDYVKALQPKMVIPHHQDDFPPHFHNGEYSKVHRACQADQSRNCDKNTGNK
jgi:L-ascorbate metabolism protein UlaG (beta-lactamase superfamily)